VKTWWVLCEDVVGGCCVKMWWMGVVRRRGGWALCEDGANYCRMAETTAVGVDVGALSVSMLLMLLL